VADEKLNAHHKALRINLDHRRFGAFAEIGAGQEVARWFFRVGGAAGTVAKTISAYDMTVSDAIYGPTDRYVSRRRLQAMLDHEFQLLLLRLDATRGSDTAFFAFADTVTARSYSRQEDGHGWLGVRFQAEPRAEPSEIVIHIRMLDRENVREQEALGMVGVNLLHGAFYSYRRPEALIGSLLDGLRRDRIEVDLIKFSGPAFEGVDNRLMSLQLVEQRLTHASMFTAGQGVVEPAEVLHQKPILLVRGSFRPVTNAVLDMITGARRMLEEHLRAGEEPVSVLEMSLRNLLSQDGLDHRDFLARVDMLGALGQTVMVSNLSRFDEVTGHLRRYTRNRIAIAVGAPVAEEVLSEKYYRGLEGGILEALGRLYQGPVEMYVYPAMDPAGGETTTAERLKVAQNLAHLHAHLLENGLLRTIQGFDPRKLHLEPREVLRRIQAGDPSWETMVPEVVVRIIKETHWLGLGEKVSG
jgi:hypothetical protein